jgi:hypothetical protein
MPLAELVQPQRDKNGPMDRPIGLVTCPNCQVAMPRISLRIKKTYMGPSIAVRGATPKQGGG